MHSFLKQSTAAQSRSIGPFLDDTDFKTEETALTIANTDIKLMINGAASANKNSGGGTHRANGVYGITFDATDTATVGEIFVSVKVAGALPVFATFVVVEEAIYDALFAASANAFTGAAGSTTLTALAANAIAAANIASSAFTAAKFATDAIDSNAVAANAATEIGTAVWATAARTLTANTNFNDLNAAGVRAAVGLASANLDTQLAAIAGFIDTEVASILTATSAASIRAALGLASANLDTQLDALPTNAELATALGTADDAVLAAIAALQNISAATVKAQVVAALATDTYAEIAVPAATASLADKIRWLCTLARNEIRQTATAQTVRNDANSGDLGTSTVSDDGTTFTRGEFA